MAHQKEASVFIKIENYKEILDIVDTTKKKIAEAHEIIDKITEIKNKEDLEIENWRSELDDVEKKVHFIDQTLFEPETY
jgi:hypothetical protein